MACEHSLIFEINEHHVARVLDLEELQGLFQEQELFKHLAVLTRLLPSGKLTIRP